MQQIQYAIATANSEIQETILKQLASSPGIDDGSFFESSGIIPTHFGDKDIELVLSRNPGPFDRAIIHLNEALDTYEIRFYTSEKTPIAYEKITDVYWEGMAILVLSVICEDYTIPAHTHIIPLCPICDHGRMCNDLMSHGSKWITQ